MSEWQQIAIALFELYLALGVMAIGFGFMFAGKDGGARAARFYFVGSSRWTLQRTRALLGMILVALWSGFVLLIARPLMHALRRAARWVVNRARSRLQPRRRT